MNKEAKAMFADMQHHHQCGCHCGCPTDNLLEAMAVQYGTRAANVNAAAMEAYQLQTAAQNALLLNMQARLTNDNGTT